MPRRSWTRLRRDTRGAAAVEFAFLAPFMIFLYFGMVEYCQGYMALKRTSHISTMVADLISQNDSTTADEIDDAFAIGELVMRPFPTAELRQRISSITRDSDTQYTVNWSRTLNMTEKLDAADADIPDDMLANGESVIIAEAFYDYSSPFDLVAPYITQFKRTTYMRPRTVEIIACTGC